MDLVRLLKPREFIQVDSEIEMKDLENRAIDIMREDNTMYKR